MQLITLATIPNQRFTYEENNNTFDITIRVNDKFTLMDIIINDDKKLVGLTPTILIPVIPYPYLTPSGFGNFIFDGDPKEKLDFNKFNLSQKLITLNENEVKLLNANR